MRAVWALLVGAAIGWFGATGCSSGPAPCQSSCGGCCDLTNTCQPGTADTACGDNALQCQRCTPGKCVDHACVGGPDGGLGGGTGTGGGSAGGSGGGTGTGGGTAGGSGGGGGGGTAGGSGGGTGGGGTFVEPDAGTIIMTFGNCPPFVACGGNPIGTWVYTTECIPDADFQGMIMTADQICGAGATTISNKSGWAKGWAWFNGTDARRSVQGNMAFTATMTGVCSVSSYCSTIQNNLASIGLSGTCGISGGWCVCQLNGGVNIDDTSTYTISGHTITLTDVNKTFDFCVSGSKIVTRETTAGSNTKEPGYPSAQKQ